MHTRLSVVLEASCLADARRDAGIGRYARQLSDALRRLDGVDATLAIPRHRPLSESRPGRFMHAQPESLRIAMRVKPDVVHGLGGEPLVGFPWSRQVVTVHDVEMWRSPARDGFRQLGLRAYGAPLAHMLRTCAAVIAVSTTSAEEAVETLNLDPGRVHVVPHGVAGVFTAETGAGDELEMRELGLTPGSYILWTGSLRHHDPRKSLDTLVDAVARLGPDAPPLALAGAGGAEAKRVFAAGERLGLRVVLCGRREDDQLAALYRHAAVFALASTHEGFGLSALEAMACGTPVVATSAGNLPELTAGAALLAPPGDPAALAGALGAVLGDGVRASGMREAGRVRAQDFTWAQTAAATTDVYRGVAVNSSRIGRRTAQPR